MAEEGVKPSICDLDHEAAPFRYCPTKGCDWTEDMLPTKGDDNVNHPSHYTAYKGLEVIDFAEQMNFNRGNAVKYIARAGLKDKSKEIEDLAKARWYIEREIQRLMDA